MGNISACCRRRRRAYKHADSAGYYAALGVQPTATSAEIDAALDRITASMRLDGAGDASTRQFFRAIKAYSVLSDPHKRVLYDKSCEEGVGVYDSHVHTRSGGTQGTGTTQYGGDPNSYELFDSTDRVPQHYAPIDRTEGFLAANASYGPWNEHSFRANRIASDQLVLVRHITTGEFGDLWLGQVGETQVAVKQLKSKDQNQANAVMLAAEIVRMTQLSHPKIAAFVGVEWTKQWETRAVAEFLPRGDLRSLLNSPKTAALDWANFKCQVAIDIVDALTYLQSQPCALMGTLTSRNVLLDGDDGLCKLSLFAVARSRHRHLDSAPYLPWVAPEIVLGENSPAAASAIYSFGVLLCELDTARLPFFDAFNPDGSPMSSYKIAQLVALGKLEPSLSEECPEGIASLARDCLLFDPLSRPTAARIAYRLREVLKNDL